MRRSSPGERKLKARAFAYYNTEDYTRWGREELPDLRKEISGWLDSQTLNEGVVLELGCGKGAFGGFHPQYVGVDISFTALKDFLKGRRTVQADIEQLPLKDNCARFIFSIATLEHVPHPENVLQEIDRVLRPGGIAVLAPAWFCRPWAAKALPAKSYRELSWADRFWKAAIPIRNSLALRALLTIPRRIGREIRLALGGGQTEFEYKRLSPNLKEYVYTDCDAFTSMDPHSLITYFYNKGYEIINAGNFWRRVLIRSVSVLIRKPCRPGGCRPLQLEGKHRRSRPAVKTPPLQVPSGVQNHMSFSSVTRR